MIIGPNGTGKSTLVCAICLGLGWSTSHLGRAKDLGEFVKHGAKRAEIEIELARDPDVQETNPIITTRITKDGNKADYAIDRRKANKKSVQQLARSFSIQVDNLCQFLPQDRVVEFAALSPENLLIQTQRAAAPDYMIEWHEQLKELRKDQRTQKDEQQRLMESLKQDENRQRLQEADVVRLRERSALQERKAVLEKLRPFPEYAAVKRKHDETKVRKQEAEKELKQLQRNLEPNLRAVKAKDDYRQAIAKTAAMRQRLLQRQEGAVAENKRKYDDMQAQIIKCADDITAEKQSNKVNCQAADRFRREIAQIERMMQEAPEPFDSAAMNEQLRDVTRRKREVEDRAREVKQQIENALGQGRQRERIVQQCVEEKESLLSQAGKQANKLKSASRDAAVAWDWIKENREKFEGEVYGPPIVECTMKNQGHAAAIETVVQDGDKFAFTVTSQRDFEILNKSLYSELKLSSVNIRSSEHSVSSFQAPMSSEALQRYGLECYMLDLIEGPEPVLAMLCDNSRLHQTAYGTRDVSNAQYEDISRSSLSSWVSGKQYYQIVRRREYGEHATSTRVNQLKQPKFFTDAPVDRQQEQELNAREREARGEIAELRQEIKSLQAENNKHKEALAKIEEERVELQDAKNERQRKLAEFNSLPAKVQRAQEKLDENEEKKQGSRDRIRAIIEKGDVLTLSKGQLVLDYANAVDALRTLHTQVFQAEILLIEATSDLAQLEARHTEEQRLLDDREQEVQRLTQATLQLREEGKRLAEICRKIGDTLTDEQSEVHGEVVGAKWTPDQLDTEIQSVQARLDMTHGGGNQNTLREFEERASRIETKKSKLVNVEENLQQLFADIEELRGRWEPELDSLIAQISEAFAENFTRIQCAGEVAIHKDEDFEQWAIQIKVKFRFVCPSSTFLSMKANERHSEHEQLSILDSHRQSGGERAVSTIFYLMALQSLARAPFRVVDEINQGMDPRNERLVHSRMVDIACAEHTSQYFLITPKLLNGLKYHPNMKVHCIASGEYMPDDHSELNFGTLAQKALAIRNGVGANVEVAV